MTTVLDTLPDLESAGAGATAREIAQQPDLWAAVAGIVADRRTDLDAFLRPLLARPELRIVLTGAGTSAFAGQVVAPALSRRLHRVVEAVATTDIVSAPRECFAADVPTLLVSFARSGDSPESVAATQLADQCLTEVHHLVVTCNADGRLARDHAAADRSLVLGMPAASNDRGFAMTSSFTCMVLGTWLALAGDLPGDGVDRLVAAGRKVVAQAGPVADALAATGPRSVVYLGSGSLKGLAEESALKLLELTTGAITVTSDSPLGFRHGPKAVLDARTVVVVYLSTDRHTRAYDLDLVRELRAQLGAGQVHVVDGDDEPDPTTPGPRFAVPGVDDLGDVLLAVAAAPVPQLIGLACSLAAGRTPDNPFPDGEVNRVVQGVTVHPLAD
ncbi:SIS domain-containing protein [Klenkia taihuensis]|uniref:Galactosamine 6-phosphate isomerase AgaS n=1 Tax=Klenkia taihuensis TaxID=1225127 RepID=A0A1I1PZ52_9ACTN|nr:SIS domain-containing protein [Klenkia taihuensis]GHE08291.1 putative tagatose-6-phosphate ketose/aldose isomerase [Klenkia taihuensis]SFD15164.1 galactosamine 6-phosphate isomerase AgaS [Klenkia taihuensis]